MVMPRPRATLVTGIVIILVAMSWRFTTGPVLFVATVALNYASAWVIWVLWSSEPSRQLGPQFLVHVVLLAVLGLLELPALIGAVDYRLVLEGPLRAPSRDPRYLPDSELLYPPRPGDRRTGSGGPGDVPT